MDNCMLITGNDRKCSKEEREQYIIRAVDLYIPSQGSTILEDVSNQSSSTEKLHEMIEHDEPNTDALSSGSKASSSERKLQADTLQE